MAVYPNVARSDDHQRVGPGQDLSLQEVLEFLGDWETDEGEWVDPGNLDWLVETDQDDKKNE